MKKIILKTVLLLYFLILVVLALCSCSIFVKWPMYVSGYSSLFTSHFNTRYLFYGIALVGLAWLLRRKIGYFRTISLLNIILAAVFLITQLAYTVILSFTARKYNTEVSFFRSFKGYEATRAKDETHTYLMLDGKNYDLDVYKPKTDAETLSTPIVYVHGGGFIEGNRTYVGYAAKWFTDRGYTVFSISYPLATDTMQTWESAANAVATAMGYVAANAQKFAIDPQRLVLAGGSAGGALVLQADLGLRKGFVQAYDSLSPPTPAAVISIYPPVSLSALYQKIEEGENIDLRPAAKSYLGGSPRDYPDRYAQLNLIDQLSEGISPTIIVTGDVDHVVNVEATRAFVKQTQKENLPVDYVEIPYGEHVFDANPNSIASQIVWNKIALFLSEKIP